MPAARHVRATTRTHTRTAATLHRTTTSVRRVGATRRAPQSIVLTPAERRTIYRNIVQQRVIPAPGVTQVITYPAEETVVPPSATTGYAVAYAPAPATTYPSNVFASAGYPVTYTVGSVIPASVPRAPVPQAVALLVPQAQRYQYAVVNNRVLLVDPLTGVVAADVTP